MLRKVSQRSECISGFRCALLVGSSLLNLEWGLRFGQGSKSVLISYQRFQFQVKQYGFESEVRSRFRLYLSAADIWVELFRFVG